MEKRDTITQLLAASIILEQQKPSFERAIIKAQNARKKINEIIVKHGGGSRVVAS